MDDTRICRKRKKKNNCGGGVVRTEWNVPECVVVFKKWRTKEATEAALTLINYLQVKLKNELIIFMNYEKDEKNISVPNLEQYVSSEYVADLIICVGGDGTVLYAASQFPGEIPPMLCFAMGSLGYMTAFEFKNYRWTLDRIFRPTTSSSEKTLLPFSLTRRVRLQVEIRRNIHNHRSGKAPQLLETDSCGICVAKRYVVMNEVVCRGVDGNMVTLDAFVDGHHLTSVAADGILVATPTGSTAYNLSAGGSIVEPSISAMMFTPICPHSLSFRPLLLPITSRMRLEVPIDARTDTLVLFDGKDPVSLTRGDAIIIKSATHPLTLFDSSDGFDFIRGLKMKLNWNVRESQKPLGNQSHVISSSDASDEAPEISLCSKGTETRIFESEEEK